MATVSNSTGSNSPTSSISSTPPHSPDSKSPKTPDSKNTSPTERINHFYLMLEDQNGEDQLTEQEISDLEERRSTGEYDSDEDDSEQIENHIRELSSSNDTLMSVNVQLSNENDVMRREIAVLRSKFNETKDKLENMTYKMEEFEIEIKMKDSKIRRLEGTIEEKAKAGSQMKAQINTMRNGFLSLKKKFWDLKEENNPRPRIRRRQTCAGIKKNGVPKNATSGRRMKKQRSFSAKYTPGFFQKQIEDLNKKMEKRTRRRRQSIDHNIKFLNARVRKERELLGLPPPESPPKKRSGNSSEKLKVFSKNRTREKKKIGKNDDMYSNLNGFQMTPQKTDKPVAEKNEVVNPVKVKDTFDSHPKYEKHPEHEKSQNKKKKDGKVTAERRAELQLEVIQDLGLLNFYDGQKKSLVRSKRGYVCTRLKKFPVSLRSWKRVYCVVDNNCVTFFESESMIDMNNCYSVNDVKFNLTKKEGKSYLMELTLGRIILDFTPDKPEDANAWSEFFSNYLKYFGEKKKNIQEMKKS